MPPGDISRGWFHGWFGWKSWAIVSADRVGSREFEIVMSVRASPECCWLLWDTVRMENLETRPKYRVEIHIGVRPSTAFEGILWEGGSGILVVFAAICSDPTRRNCARNGIIFEVRSSSESVPESLWHYSFRQPNLPFRSFLYYSLELIEKW